MGYTAFGTSYSPRTTIEIDQRYTYTGRETTTDPTLMYYRWRMYAPRLGRFTTRDPYVVWLNMASSPLKKRADDLRKARALRKIRVINKYNMLIAQYGAPSEAYRISNQIFFGCAMKKKVFHPEISPLSDIERCISLSDAMHKFTSNESSLKSVAIALVPSPVNYAAYYKMSVYRRGPLFAPPCDAIKDAGASDSILDIYTYASLNPLIFSDAYGLQYGMHCEGNCAPDDCGPGDVCIEEMPPPTNNPFCDNSAPNKRLCSCTPGETLMGQGCFGSYWLFLSLIIVLTGQCRPRRKKLST